MYAKSLRLVGTAHVCVCARACVRVTQTGGDASPLPTLLSCVGVCGSKRASVDSRWTDSGGVRAPVSVLNRGYGLFPVSPGPLGAHTLDVIVRDVCGFTPAAFVWSDIRGRQNALLSQPGLNPQHKQLWMVFGVYPR